MTITAPLDFLRTPVGSPIEPWKNLWGFGGFHGGLTLGLLAAAMREHVPDGILQSATARFQRPVTDSFRVETSLDRPGRALTAVSGRAVGERGTLVDASAIFTTARTKSWTPFAPPMPAAPPPAECELFAIPPEFVPIGAHCEIRPVGPNRPYAGCAEPELTAWIRPTDHDAPPDPYLFVFLMDALAPSYAAVLSDLLFVPTVELSVRVAPALDTMTTPWVLLHARTHSASADGWVDEHIDAWGEDGVHLGSARQLRIVRKT